MVRAGNNSGVRTVNFSSANRRTDANFIARDDSIAIQLKACQTFLTLALCQETWLMKRTLRGSKLKARKDSGFMSRMSTKAGRKVLKKRRAKGRYRLAVV